MTALFLFHLVIPVDPLEKNRESHQDILDLEEGRSSEHLKEQDIKFEMGPSRRFGREAEGETTMFFYDPSGNALEFKVFKNINQLC